MTDRNENSSERTALPDDGVAEDTSSGEPSPAIESDYGVVKVVENVEMKRIQLFFPAKPDDATLEFLKGCGFRWSRYSKCWQQPLGNAARFVVTTLLARLGVSK